MRLKVRRFFSSLHHCCVCTCESLVKFVHCILYVYETYVQNMSIVYRHNIDRYNQYVYY